MKKRFVAALALLIVLNVLVFFWDNEIVNIVKQSRTDYLDYVFLSVAFVSSIVFIFFILTSLFLWSEHKRRWILPLWLSGFYAYVVSYIIKVLVARPRPFQMNLITPLSVGFYFIKNSFKTWNFSFPSFHAMVVFAALPVMNKEFKKLKYIWLIFACLTAFARVYFGFHYLSDVLAGAIIGYLIGLMIVYLEEEKEWGKRIMKKLKWGK